MVSRKFGILCLTLLFLAGACAWMQPSPAELEEALKARVQAYWQYRIKRQLAESYAMESPLYREKVNLSQHLQIFSSGIVMRRVVVGSAAIEGENAQVSLTLYFSFPDMYSPKGGFSRPLKDPWHLVDGVWYHRIETAGNSRTN